MNVSSRSSVDRSNEIEFLIACATPRSYSARLATLAEGVDWQEVERMAAFHRMRPLLFQRAGHLAPASLRPAWKEAQKASAVRSMKLTKALIDVCGAFAEARTPVLPHKGPLVALAAYGNLAAREFGDLDLLVAPDRLETALAILARLGYRREPALEWLTAGALSRWSGELSCVSAEGVSIDLHWRLTSSHYPAQLDPVLLWPRVRRANLGESGVPDLEPEALFILLAVHGGKHGWESLGWLADVAWLLERSPNFDWDRAAGLASASNCVRPFRLTLVLAREAFGARVPGDLEREATADKTCQRLAQRVMDRWRRGGERPLGTRELLPFAVAFSRGPWPAVRHVIGLFFGPTHADWRAWRLPEGMFALYPTARLGRLLVRGLTGGAPAMGRTFPHWTA